MRSNRIIAYLRFSQFEAKVRTEWMPIIKIPIILPLKMNYTPQALPLNNEHPIFIFEWRRQLTKFKHEYTLKEIER